MPVGVLRTCLYHADLWPVQNHTILWLKLSPGAGSTTRGSGPDIQGKVSTKCHGSLVENVYKCRMNSIQTFVQSSVFREINLKNWRDLGWNSVCHLSCSVLEHTLTIPDLIWQNIVNVMTIRRPFRTLGSRPREFLWEWWCSANWSRHVKAIVSARKYTFCILSYIVQNTFHHQSFNLFGLSKDIWWFCLFMVGHQRFSMFLHVRQWLQLTRQLRTCAATSCHVVSFDLLHPSKL